MTYKLPLDGIEISKKVAQELIDRMNKHWPGKYVLVWPEPPYSNNMRNPLMPVYHSARC